jgi:CheY-like chemotaxis protein
VEAGQPYNIQEDSSRDLILIVDDDKISRRLLSILLQNMGFRTLCIEDGYYLTFSCSYFTQIKAILMDMGMPKLDGYTTTKKIRKLLKKGKSTYHMPIFAVTASENGKKCLKAGCDLHIVKPISREMLTQCFQEFGLLKPTQETGE